MHAIELPSDGDQLIVLTTGYKVKYYWMKDGYPPKSFFDQIEWMTGPQRRTPVDYRVFVVPVDEAEDEVDPKEEWA